MPFFKVLHIMCQVSSRSCAREMNLSETAFVRRSSIATFGVRYFTPAEEIPMAGHPTIATTFALVESGRLPLQEERTAITLELPGGPLPVEIYAEQGKVKQIVMTQRKPMFLKQYNPSDVLPLFGLSVDDVLSDVPIQTVSTGTPQLMIPLRNQDTLRRVTLDIANYSRFRAEADFFSPHLFCLGGATAEGKTFARHFGTPPDTFEDPATGSATGGMAAYLWHYKLIDELKFLAEQGHWMKRPSTIYVEIVGSHDAIEAVKVGGSAVVVLRGELAIQGDRKGLPYISIQHCLTTCRGDPCGLPVLNAPCSTYLMLLYWKVYFYLSIK